MTQENSFCHIKSYSKKLLIILIWMHALSSTMVMGQIPPATFPDSLFILPPISSETDTLPPIIMKFEPAYLIIWAVVPSGALFMSGYSYKIGEKKKALASRMRPYFEATHNQVILELYQKHKKNKGLWYAFTGTGSVVSALGFAHAIVSIFNPAYSRAAGVYLLSGCGLMIGGLAARVTCFGHLRKAVNLYNYQHASKKPVVSMGLGTPTSTPLGAGVYLKF